MKNKVKREKNKRMKMMKMAAKKWAKNLLAEPPIEEKKIEG